MKYYNTISYNNINSTYYIDSEEETISYSYLYSQTYTSEFENNYISYNSFNIELATINFDLSYIDILKNFKNNIDNNLLVVSMLDDKMYYDRNSNKSSYQYNNILYINNDKDIILLSSNINNIDSPLTIIDGEIQIKIDGHSIINENKQLVADYNTFNLANSNTKGIFKVDNESLMLENNKVTLSYSIADVVDNIDDHINIMNSVISQSSYNLEKVQLVFREYPLYDKKYSCNIDDESTLYYSGQNVNDIEMYDRNENTNNFYHIDYDEKYFKIRIKILYNYMSSNITDYNPFNEKYLNVVIEETTDILSENLFNKDGELYTKYYLPDYITFNRDKSYIYNEGIISFDQKTNNIYGEINYICYFNINQEAIYNQLNKMNFENNPKFIDFKITINYNDSYINIDSSTFANLEMFINMNKDNLSLHKILYHDYEVGFNYNKIGKQIGICMIPNSEYYEEKPIFLKYIIGENNYTINYISNDIFKNYQNNVIKSTGNYTNGFDSSNLGNSIVNQNINDDIIYYKDIDIEDINSNISGLRHYYNNSGNKYVNELYNVNKIYKYYSKYCFNDTYNVFGNGLRKGDCYVPCCDELMLFYKYGFYPYLNYIEDEQYDNSDTTIFDSSTLYYDNTNWYMYSLFIPKNITSTNHVNIKPRKIGLLKIDEYGRYISEGTTEHISINCFKIPDYSVINNNYYSVIFDEEDNCEVINYSTKNDVYINIKKYKNTRFSLEDFIILYDTDNIEISPLRYSTINSKENIYQIKFTINKFKDYMNCFDIYFKDTDEGFNQIGIKNYKELSLEEIENINQIGQGNTITYYRKLCRISTKIE